MLRTTPNSVKESKETKLMIQDYKKQQSQPLVGGQEGNNFFLKFQQQRAKQSLKPTNTTSKSIEEKRYKVHKNNISEANNRTNSSSKSRLVQVDDDSLYSSQNALKLKKIIGDSTITSQILKQLYTKFLNRSKQNLTCDSSSPGIRQNKSSYKRSCDMDLVEKTLLHKKTQSLSVGKQKELNDQLWTLEKNVQSSLAEQLKKQQFLRSRGIWDQFKEVYQKQFAKIPIQYRSQFNSITQHLKDIEQQWSELLVCVSNNLFDLFCNSAILMACEQDAKLNEKIEQMRRERDIWQNNCKQVEQERDILLETVQQLKQTIEQNQQQQQQQQNKVPKDLDQMDTAHLREMSQAMQQKIQEMSEKEGKLIKLVLAIRRSGVDIEKIYNEEVLNDDSVSEVPQSSFKKSTRPFMQSSMDPFSVHDADNSVVNDSDESSFCFQGRLDNDSIIESIRRFENQKTRQVSQDSRNNTVKLKLDLSKCNNPLKQQQQQQYQQQQQQQQQHKQSQIKLKIPENQDNVGFHQEFMMKFNEFSESWRIQALKDERRTKFRIIKKVFLVQTYSQKKTQAQFSDSTLSIGTRVTFSSSKQYQLLSLFVQAKQCPPLIQPK